ncbi:MAG TPA: monovalent cation/H(+) antiporter subunit G [Streptosporangiaceae bacterium]
MREAFVIALAAVGVAFSLSGAVGILRMPDVYSRIQCSSKTITMGALPVLVALVVGRGVLTPFGSRALLVAVLLLVVNPAASHALARAAYKAGVPMWPGAVRDDPKTVKTAGQATPRKQTAGQAGKPDGDPDRQGGSR